MSGTDSRNKVGTRPSRNVVEKPRINPLEGGEPLWRGFALLRGTAAIDRVKGVAEPEQ